MASSHCRKGSLCPLDQRAGINPAPTKHDKQMKGLRYSWGDLRKDERRGGWLIVAAFSEAMKSPARFN